VKQTKQNGRADEVGLPQRPNTLRTIGYNQREGRNMRLSTIDRIAVAAIFVAALFILAVIGVVPNAERRPIATAETLPMPLRIGVPVSEWQRGSSIETVIHRKH
jgi:hypothetical protein